jgi:hypothetical protein
VTHVHRFFLTAIAVLSFSGSVLAQAPAPADAQDVAGSSGPFPAVTFGVQTFLEYGADLHESNNFNAFDVTRGYLNIQARLNDRVRVRFTPDVRPTTDANLNQNLALRMAYASLDAQVTDNVAVMFGLHETPWLSFEESVNRYRVLGPFLAERIGLIPGPTDLGASIKYSRDRMQIHAGVYNGEGDGRAEIDAYKSMDGRVTLRPFDNDSELGPLQVSGFYQYGWYAKDRPRNVAIFMANYEKPMVSASLQYLSATDNPFVAVDVQRRGLSFFGEIRQGPIGWAGIIGLDFITPDVSNDASQQRRLVFGGGKWLEVGRGRLGIIGSLETITQSSNAQVLQRRLLAQTQVEF